jgi:hypothetical protein
MSNVGSRPYVGTWRLSATKLVQHTPDALVYVNGDTSLPGCPKCNGRIDIQQFITEVSVDAGTDPGSHSASFSLSIPMHHTDSFARDARFLLRPGLEIHVYMRGYFPVKGLYEHLAEPTIPDDAIGASGQSATKKGGKGSVLSGEAGEAKKIEGGVGKYKMSALLGSSGCAKMAAEGKTKGGCGPEFFTDSYMAELQTKFNNPNLTREDIANNMVGTLGMMNSLESYVSQIYGGAQVTVQLKGGNGGLSSHGHAEHSQHYLGTACDHTLKVKTADGWVQVPPTTVWAAKQKLRQSGHFPPGGDGVYLQGGQTPNSDPKWSDDGHMDHGGSRGWVWMGGDKLPTSEAEKWRQALKPNVDKLPAPGPGVPAWKDGVTANVGSGGAMIGGDGLTAEETALQAKGLASEYAEVQGGESYLAKLGLAGQGIEDVLAYPYYHVFRGVVTQVDHSYSGGVQSISVSCASLLHFWQYHNMSTNASVFGARPTNSQLRRSMVGSVFTGMHPYQIIWTLHNDMVGAAGGVAWALRSKSNQDAKTEFGGESLFSLNIKYWERRFALKETKLRLHGASGELFSALQAAFLAKTKGGHLTKLLKSRFRTQSDIKDPSGILEQAKSVGLFNRHKLNALLFAARSKGADAANTAKFEINLVEMQAFVSDIGNWGQINLFESAYESKLDVAQKVMGITGFEFYQDVDGDFVFKPPMYNLDTSESRVYRIEDIDIQNISFSEKEPEVTYMTVTGSHFKNLAGMGLDGEWGVRGQYIDYRLVAQFGWRPGDFETAYFNDSRSMFFSAMTRMDILNIGVNSASVTMPIRAELRPGYPVYIPYLDCYYYCNSFAHSFSAGGSCTTSLQLVGKRSKFYAPGKPGQEGVESIDLGNTVLPERPLEILGLDGKPRLAGFPNVVMALDPDHLNPLFFIVGTDIENLATQDKGGKWHADEQVLRNLLRAAKSLGVVKAIGEDGSYTIAGEGKDAQDIVLFFDPGTGNKAAEGQIDLMGAAVNFGQAQEAALKKVQDAKKSLAPLDKEHARLRAQLQATTSTKNSSEAGSEKQEAAATEVDRLTYEIATLEGKMEDQARLVASGTEAFNGLLTGKDTAETYKQALVLKQLIEQVSAAYRGQVGDQRFGDTNSTINLLDMLSDKKATFSNGTQPGSYRYYSSADPRPMQQGQPILAYNREFLDKEDPEKGSTVTLEQVKAEVDPEYNFPTVQFVPSAQVSAPADGMKIPEAKLAEGKYAKLGIRVLTGNSAKPLGEVLPTHMIHELMFSVQSAVFARAGTVINTGVYREAVKKEVYKAIKEAFIAAILDDPEKTPHDLWDGPTLRFTEAVGTAEDAAVTVLERLQQQKGLVQDAVRIGFAEKKVPDLVKVGKVGRPSDQPFSKYPYKGNEEWPDAASWGKNQENIEEQFRLREPGDKSLRVLQEEFASVYAGNILDIFWEMYKLWKGNLEAALGKKHSASIMPEVTGRFWEVLATAFKFRTVPMNRAMLTLAQRKKDISFSPVFPVSDHLGYTVIGSYRYGRGISISPNGMWDQMANQDPLSVLDKGTRDELLRLYVQGKSVTVMLPVMVDDPKNKGQKIQAEPLRLEAVTLNPKSPGKKPGEDVPDPDMARYEKHLLSQLRRTLTNSQILEYGLATVGEDPDMLQMNLANWVSDGREGIHKIPVINAAYSLADLGLHTSQSVCECKAAEASILVSAYGQAEFLPIAGGPTDVPAGIDKGTLAVMEANTKATPAWRASQNAMRGTSPDRGRSSIVEQFKGLKGEFDRAGADTKARADQLAQSTESLSQQWQKLKGEDD